MNSALGLSSGFRVSTVAQDGMAREILLNDSHFSKYNEGTFIIESFVFFPFLMSDIINF